MNIQPDFKELLELLEKNNVEYMIIGGYAVAFHGYPRFTKDIDIFYELSDNNIKNIINALIDFGFPKQELDKALFANEENIVTFGIEPVRVDFINKIDGVEFSSAKSSCVRGKYGDIDVLFIGKEHLLANKKATTRLKDKVDLEELS